MYYNAKNKKFMHEYLSHIANHTNTEVLSGLLLVFCFASMLYLWRNWGTNGLYVYNALAIVVANIQVLKITTLSFISEPLAVGTIVFATTFTVSDILTEHKGSDVAKKGILLSFTAQIIMTVLMLLTVVYPSMGDIKGQGPDGNIIDPIQYSLFMLFSPSLRILFASLVSYYISQQFDIYLFKKMKSITHKKMLWLRLNVSTMLSGLLDNILFSTLAWVILSPDPVTFHTLMVVYILGTYGARVIVSLASTPVLYMSYYVIGKKKTHDSVRI